MQSQNEQGLTSEPFILKHVKGLIYDVTARGDGLFEWNIRFVTTYSSLLPISGNEVRLVFVDEFEI